MYKGKHISVVVPAYNEESQIESVVDKMPEIVDTIIIVNDTSTDKTKEVIEGLQKRNDKVKLVNHDINQGVGGAIASGYMFANNSGTDIAVVMAGDNQMSPDDLPAILDPVADEKADYSKGNRLITGEAYQRIPKVRYFGNAVLSLLTKIASGYWHVADSQTGYTAINKKGLGIIDWNSMYKRYGQPNDLLIRLNVENCIVKDVPIEPVYNVGEKSGIKLRVVIFTIPWLLLKMFLWRLKEKYVIRNFHPLVFFYFLGILFGISTMFLFTRLSVMWYMNGVIPSINALAAMFSFMSSSMFTMFAMWFDMEENKSLR
jgi:glycosyltransferase involved in cell wall biosynthesis